MFALFQHAHCPRSIMLVFHITRLLKSYLKENLKGEKCMKTIYSVYCAFLGQKLKDGGIFPVSELFEKLVSYQ